LKISRIGNSRGIRLPASLLKRPDGDPVCRSFAKAKAEIAVDQIRTISKTQIISRMDTLSFRDARKLRDLISEMYGNG
jgi:hypothetical protein